MQLGLASVFLYCAGCVTLDHVNSALEAHYRSPMLKTLQGLGPMEWQIVEILRNSDTSSGDSEGGHCMGCCL